MFTLDTMLGHGYAFLVLLILDPTLYKVNAVTKWLLAELTEKIFKGWLLHLLFNEPFLSFIFTPMS